MVVAAVLFISIDLYNSIHEVQNDYIRAEVEINGIGERNVKLRRMIKTEYLFEATRVDWRYSLDYKLIYRTSAAFKNAESFINRHGHIVPAWINPKSQRGIVMTPDINNKKRLIQSIISESLKVLLVCISPYCLTFLLIKLIKKEK
jgi:hypothetical protein